VLTIPSVEPNSAHVKFEPELQLDSSTDPYKLDIFSTSPPNAPSSAENPSSVMQIPKK